MAQIWGRLSLLCTAEELGYLTGRHSRQGVFVPKIPRPLPSARKVGRVGLPLSSSSGNAARLRGGHRGKADSR